MINYDSFSLCYHADIFFVMHTEQKSEDSDQAVRFKPLNIRIATCHFFVTVGELL